MQIHVTEAIYPEENLPARFARGSHVQKSYFRWILHSMTENKVQCRLTFSEELLQVVRHAKETNIGHLLTSHESWLHYKHHHDSVGVASRATVLT
jgi:hypothetical protein